MKWHNALIIHAPSARPDGSFDVTQRGEMTMQGVPYCRQSKKEQLTVASPRGAMVNCQACVKRLCASAQYSNWLVSQEIKIPGATSHE